MLITEELIERAKTRNGAWTKKQLEILGVPWPPKKGWKATVIGTEIADDKAASLVAIGAEPGLERLRYRNPSQLDEHFDTSDLDRRFDWLINTTD